MAATNCTSTICRNRLSRPYLQTQYSITEVQAQSAAVQQHQQSNGLMRCRNMRHTGWHAAHNNSRVDKAQLATILTSLCSRMPGAAAPVAAVRRTPPWLAC
jgi:protein-tyrosine-phosphatase